MVHKYEVSFVIKRNHAEYLRKYVVQGYGVFDSRPIAADAETELMKLCRQIVDRLRMYRLTSNVRDIIYCPGDSRKM